MKNMLIIKLILSCIYIISLSVGLIFGVIYDIKALWITCLVFIILYKSSSLTNIKNDEDNKSEKYFYE